MRREALRTAWGLYQVKAAGRVAGVELGRDADSLARRTVRILGARQVVQGVVLSRSASRAAHRVGGIVDLVHAASMVAVALTGRRYRRGALLDAGIAMFFAVSEFGR